MGAIKKFFSVLGTAIVCAILLAILGIVALSLSMKFGMKTIFVMDGAFVAFLIVRKIFRKLKKSEA